MHSDGSHKSRNDDGSKIVAFTKLIITDISQSCEVLQLVKGGNATPISESPVQISHCGGFIVRKVTIAVGVPKFHASCLYGGVSKDNAVPGHAVFVGKMCIDHLLGGVDLGRQFHPGNSAVEHYTEVSSVQPV